MEQQTPRRQTPVAAVVIGGLVTSMVAGIFLIDPPNGELPGVALGSEAILVVERIAALFAAWLMALIVIARALTGELPVEISGRGLRYADAVLAQDNFDDSESAFERVDDEIEALYEAIATVQARQRLQMDLLRRYAMRSEGNGN